MIYTYSTGTWIGVTTASGAALLDPKFPAVTVRALWDVMSAGQPIGSWLEVLAGGGISSLPGFALVQSEMEQVRVLIRGDAEVELDETLVQAQEMSTWREHVTSGVQQVVLRGPGGDGQLWPVQAGIVFAGTIRTGTAVEQDQDSAGIGGVATYSGTGDGAGSDAAGSASQVGADVPVAQGATHAPPHAVGPARVGQGEVGQGTAEVAAGSAGGDVLLPPLSVDDVQEMPDVEQVAGSEDDIHDETDQPETASADLPRTADDGATGIGGPAEADVEAAVQGPESEREVDAEEEPTAGEAQIAAHSETEAGVDQVEPQFGSEPHAATDEVDAWTDGVYAVPEGADAGPEGADAGREGVDAGADGADAGPESADAGPEGADDPGDEAHTVAQEDGPASAEADGEDNADTEADAGLAEGSGGADPDAPLEEGAQIRDQPALGPDLDDEAAIDVEEPGHVASASQEEPSGDADLDQDEETPAGVLVADESEILPGAEHRSSAPAEGTSQDRGLIDSLPWNVPAMKAEAAEEVDQEASPRPTAEAPPEPGEDPPVGPAAAPAEEPAPPASVEAAAQAPAPATDSTDDDDDEGDHDGHTILVSHLRSAFAQDAADANESHPDDNTIIPGGDDLEEAPAHPELVVSTGQRVVLDRAVLVGRAPETARFEGPVAPRLVTVPSPEQDISRSHVEIRPEGGHVLVSDLRSTNGTVVTLPGAEPRRLHPGEVIPVGPGALIDLGDGITITVETDGAGPVPERAPGQHAQAYQPPDQLGGHGDQGGYHQPPGQHGADGQPAQHHQQGPYGTGQHAQPDPYGYPGQQQGFGGYGEYPGPVGPQGGAH